MARTGCLWFALTRIFAFTHIHSNYKDKWRGKRKNKNPHSRIVFSNHHVKPYYNYNQPINDIGYMKFQKHFTSCAISWVIKINIMTQLYVILENLIIELKLKHHTHLYKEKNVK